MDEIEERVIVHPITRTLYTIMVPKKDFRMFCEKIVVEYANKTNDPEIGLNMIYATKNDYRLYEEYEAGRIPAESYIRALSDGGFYEVMENMFCHKFR